MRLKHIFASILALAVFQGCQTVPYQGEARDVKKKPQDSGIIAIKPVHRPEDRQRADQLMQTNCAPFMVKVLEEGEVAVGSETKGSTRESDRANSQHQVGSLFGIPVIGGDKGGKDSESNTVTTAIKEWQISYQCEKPVAAQAPTASPESKKTLKR